MSHHTPQTHYEVLGIELYADITEIKSAYKARALKTHPDKNGGTAKAKEAFQHLVNAYEVLSDVTKRKSYDQTLSWFSKPQSDQHPADIFTDDEPSPWWNGYEEQVRRFEEMEKQRRKRELEEQRIFREMADQARKRLEERLKAKIQEVKEKERPYRGPVWN